MTVSRNIQAWLSPDIRMIQIGEDIVALDILHDAYTCLVGGAEHIRLLGGGKIELSHQTAVDDLESVGWLCPSPPLQIEREAQSAGQARPVPLKMDYSRVVMTGLDTIVAASLFRRQTFGELVATARRLRRRAIDRRPIDGEQLDRTVSTFATIRPWLPDQGVCLQRCFSLLQCLSRRGIVVDWVFGVRTWPFAAHCWLQLGDQVLCDDLDRVRGYVPILVV
jgi:hypothetical protein